MRLIGAMESAGRRLHQLYGLFSSPLPLLKSGTGREAAAGTHSFLQIRLLSDSSESGGKKISIGDVNKLVTEAKFPELIPRKYSTNSQKL